MSGWVALPKIRTGIVMDVTPFLRISGPKSFLFDPISHGRRSSVNSVACLVDCTEVFESPRC